MLELARSRVAEWLAGWVEDKELVRCRSELS
jgi:hypothetical protein